MTPLEEASDPTTQSARLVRLWNDHANPSDDSILKAIARNPNLDPEILAQIIERGSIAWALENPGLPVALASGHPRVNNAFAIGLSCLLATFFGTVPPEPIFPFFKRWTNYWLVRSGKPYWQRPSTRNVILEHPDGCSVVIDSVIPIGDKIPAALALGRAACEAYPEQARAMELASLLEKFATLAGERWP